MRKRNEGKRVEWEVVRIPPSFGNFCSWQSATGTPNRFPLVIFVSLSCHCAPLHSCSFSLYGPLFFIPVHLFILDQFFFSSLVLYQIRVYL